MKSYPTSRRYLNIILLNELKNSIQEDNVQGIIEKEPILDLQDSALINHESKEQFLTHKSYKMIQCNALNVKNLTIE